MEKLHLLCPEESDTSNLIWPIRSKADKAYGLRTKYLQFLTSQVSTIV